MLVLRRKAGEVIVIGGEIEIEVIEISRSRVKLGVRAPRQVAVERREAMSLAADNRRAYDLLSNGNADSIRDLLRRYPKIFGESAQVPPGSGR